MNVLYWSFITTFYSRPTQRFLPEEVIVHEEYKVSTDDSDIALIRLDGIVTTVVEGIIIVLKPF